MNVTAIVPTLNEEDNILDCLASLEWAGRRVVFDCYSTDRTVELAQDAGAEVLQHPFEDFAQFHNAAMEEVEAEWILFVDADERVTPELAAEIESTIAEDCDEVLWWIPRHNYIFGRLTKGAGWYPDYQARLLRRGYVHWERPVHEVAVANGPEGHLENPLIHYNYDDLADFKARQERYNQYDTQILFEEGVRPHAYTPYTQLVRHFWWRLVTLRGLREGVHGLRLSLLMATYEMKKYRRLARMWRDAAR
ncbi:MAG: glycosyltransferase family 2 protein, partial [Anaerolineae bacterium]|jgi:glycosyltransferase involved in cell wall biosynthesis